MGAYSADIIAWCQQVPPNEKRVRYKGDFPTAVAGVITLDPNTSYKVVGFIDLGTDVIRGSNTIIVSDPIPSVGLLTNSALPMVASDGTGGFCYLSGPQLINVGMGGLFDFTIDGAIQPAAAVVNACFLQSSGPAGTFRGDGLARLFDTGLVTSSGVTYDGAMAIEVHACAFNVPLGAPSYIGMTVTAASTISAMRVSSCTMRFAQASDRAALMSSSATYSSPATFTDNTFTGPGTVFDAGGLDQKSADVVANINTGLESSLFTARASFAGNVQVTTFADSSFVGIGNGTPGHPLFVLNAVSERFTLTGATTDVQVVTCASAQPHAYRLTAVLNVYKSGVAADVAFAWYVNNVQMTTSAVTIEVSPSRKSATISTLVTLSPGDFCQLKISNPALANIVVQAASIEAHRI